MSHHFPIAPLTVSYLSQISESIYCIDEAQLRKLDVAVSQYIKKRQKMKENILRQMEEADSLVGLDLHNLLPMRNQSQQLLLELDEETSRFARIKDYIEENNQLPLQELTTGQMCFNQIGFMLQLTKDLLIRLSRHEQIGHLVEELQEYRRTRSNFDRDQAIVEDVEKYIAQIERIFKKNEIQDQNVLDQSSNEDQIIYSRLLDLNFNSDKLNPIQFENPQLSTFDNYTSFQKSLYE